MQVASTPHKDLVYTNHAYFNDDRSQALLYSRRDNTQPDAYVLVYAQDETGRTGPQFVFSARPNPGVQPGSIGLSSLQRETLKVNLAAPIIVQPWLLPADGSRDLLSLSLQVELIGTKRVTVLAAELGPALKQQFVNQVFTREQTFCMDFQGTVLKFTVQSAEAGVPASEQDHTVAKALHGEADVDEDDVQMSREVDRGVLRPDTSLELTSPPSKFLTFKALEKKKDVLKAKFKFADMGIGGLDAEFTTIFRRSFVSRMYPPEVLKKLGVRHVKGMLLYGPPGTGKTLIARQIGKMLASREPKVVNGPEILNKFVGASEENIRNLFKDAEDDQIANGDNADLHIIIFDEIDAICKVRGRGNDSTGVHDTVVNQLLSKIDGVNSLNNILVIGMTNRKDMIDPALLRPGRLEVHVEISLPDEKGRVQIFNIHMKKMRDSGMLDPEVTAEWLASLTKNFSGAEIEGVVVAAASLALSEGVDMKTAKAVDLSGKGIMVRRHHFERALDDVKPAFGVDEDELKGFLEQPLLDYGEQFQKIMTTGRTFVDHLRTSTHTRIRSVLLEGPTGAGKTSIAAALANGSGFPFVKVVSSEGLMGLSEARKCDAILKVFEDAYKSPLSLIILDSIENLLEYVAVGPRFSQAVLQTLLVLVKRKPPSIKSKLMIIATSSQATLLESLGITQAFNVVVPVPALTQQAQVAAVLSAFKLPVAPPADASLRQIASTCYLPIAIKPLLEVADVSQEGQQVVTPARFGECLSASGYDVAEPSGRALGASAAAASYKSRSNRYDDGDDDM